MLNSIILGSVAMAGAAMAQGSAIVINSCSYDVNLAAVPASGGGATEIDQTLSSGGQWSQQWTSLTNGDGWSIKLAKDDDWNNIMQYEYTWGGSGTIWYDLSDVNGNPWDGDWEITADNGCTPRQAAYRYATDDAYGEQSCDGSASITVTLCSGDGMQDQPGSSSSAVASSASSTSAASSTPAPSSSTPAATSSSAAPVTSSPAPVTSSAPPSTTSAPVSSSPTLLSLIPESSGGYGVGFANDKVAAGNAENVKPSATTFVTSNRGGVTVTEVATQVVTNVVTATAHARRHQHHNHQHA